MFHEFLIATILFATLFLPQKVWSAQFQDDSVKTCCQTDPNCPKEIISGIIGVCPPANQNCPDSDRTCNGNLSCCVTFTMSATVQSYYFVDPLVISTNTITQNHLRLAIPLDYPHWIWTPPKIS